MNANKPHLLEPETAELERTPLEHLLAVSGYVNAELANGDEGSGLPGAMVGELTGLAPSGLPLVDFAGSPSPSPFPARHTCSISVSDIGRQAVLVFEKNDLTKPIILGLLQRVPPETTSPHPPSLVNASLDEKRVTLTAEDEIVLRCGKASVTLTRAGKVLINGEYLLSRSNGVNRIKGGSVQIN
jgi:hypothetical protein